MMGYTQTLVIIIRLLVMCFAPSAVVFGGIVMAGAFAVKYTGIMVLQVRSWKLLQYTYLQTVRTVFCFRDDRFRLHANQCIFPSKYF